jgi:hypothetical protein
MCYSHCSEITFTILAENIEFVNTLIIADTGSDFIASKESDLIEVKKVEKKKIKKTKIDFIDLEE